MKIVLWLGNESNQKALANKINAFFPVAAIVTETRKANSTITFKKVVEKIIEKLFFSSLAAAWRNMKQHYEKTFLAFPTVKILDVENINSEEAYQFTKAENPDLIIVSGTRLVKEKMLSISPSIGILNLHTGLSPYIKGGPNCTNWCLATEQFHLIGNTVMWIDKGIDTGNIFTTELTTFTGDENLDDIHLKVMEHAHDLYVRAIAALVTGNRQSIKQDDLLKGTTYYTKQWNWQQKFKAIRHVKLFQQKMKQILKMKMMKNKQYKN